uniref:I/LWEQ domain-containing protein n=1 Tax=Dicentrarchus labrax TaxID=13489 RepID=A0A8C4F4G1_DICLA
EEQMRKDPSSSTDRQEIDAVYIIMGTHKEGGATTFWSYILNLPLSSNSMVSWKFCYLLHKVLRDGHRNVSPNLCTPSILLLFMFVMCNLSLSISLSLFLSDLQHKVIPGNLEISDETLDREAGNDMTKVIKKMYCGVDFVFFSSIVLRQLDANGAKSTTPAGQCRLTPLIPLILDCSFLYHFSVLMMFKLHSIAPDVLLGHRERFRDLFTGLTQFFDRAREMEFFKSIIQIPDLPDAPPNFLRAAALGEYKKLVVVMPNEERHEEEEVEPQPEFREAPQVPQYYLLSQMGAPDASLEQRETENDSLKRELEVLKPELQLIKTEAKRCLTELKAQVNRLEAEVEEQRTHKQMAIVENEQLRMEVEALRCASVATRAQAAELRFTQLKERHAELITSHADLMKKNADTVKLLSNTTQGQDDLLRAKQQLETELENLRQERMNAQKLEIDRLRRELDSTRAELARANGALQSKEMSGTQLSSSLAGLQAEREGLLRSVRDQEAELNSLRQQAQLHQSTLEQERQRSSMELGNLHAQLQQQVLRCELAHKLQEEQFCLLQCAVVEAEGIILDAVAKVDDPIHLCCISSPDYLVNRAEITLGSIDKMQQSHMVYLGNRNDASGLLRAVTQFSHLAADTIVNGAATSHSAPTDQADCLTDSCRDCANNCLQFLRDLKLQASLPRADPSAVRYTVQRLLALGQDLRPKGRDVLKEELGYVVDKEMIATSTAIEEAVLRMDEILNQAKRDTSGVKLEGAASVTEFYAKNSCWTEGLISASKAVGWGATQLLNSADRVVGENGTYEELIACSHEIAASTAQLVAASKVKSDRNNKKLNTLQHASRHVNDMAAVVVTSTKHGQQKISDQGVMDFSGMSLIKLKTEEMEAQVKVLQLENQLEQERVRLGELRKRHYDLAQPYTPNPTQSYLNPQSYSLSQPSSHTPSLSRPQSPSLPQKTPQSNVETTTKPASRRPNIFTKSGNLLKNAVSC